MAAGLPPSTPGIPWGGGAAGPRRRPPSQSCSEGSWRLRLVAAPLGQAGRIGHRSAQGRPDQLRSAMC